MSELRYRPLSNEEAKQVCLRAEKERRERHREIIHVIGRVLEGANERFYPYISADELVTIDWKKLFEEEWNRDELLTLQWLRSMLEGKMYVKAGKRGGIFPSNWEMREALFYALAVSERKSFMVHDYFKRKLGVPPESTPVAQSSFTP